jgi:hypothetical protein
MATSVSSEILLGDKIIEVFAQRRQWTAFDGFSNARRRLA